MIAKRLQIKNVSVKFGGLSALDDVSFEVDDNQLLGFIGPNGAGKTTLMRVIMGMVNPLSGTVLLNGRNITNLKSVQRIHAGVALGQQIVKPLQTDVSVGQCCACFRWKKITFTFLGLDGAKAL